LVGIADVFILKKRMNEVILFSTFISLTNRGLLAAGRLDACLPKLTIQMVMELLYHRHNNNVPWFFEFKSFSVIRLQQE
jgi:hypothetical protein